MYLSTRLEIFLTLINVYRISNESTFCKSLKKDSKDIYYKVIEKIYQRDQKHVFLVHYLLKDWSCWYNKQ